MLDDLPISIRKRFAEELGPEGAAGRRRIAMMMKRVLPSDEVLEKMKVTDEFTGNCKSCSVPSDVMLCSGCIVAAYHELDREIAEAELRTRSHQDVANACGVSAYHFEANEYEDNMDVLGAQSAYITKLLDTKTSIKDPKVQLEVKKENAKMATRAFKRIVELKSIPEGAYVDKGKLLVSMKNSEASKVEDQTIKARLVAMGNVIFDKNLKVR